jgi:hypothetical protein
MMLLAVALGEVELDFVECSKKWLMMADGNLGLGEESSEQAVDAGLLKASFARYLLQADELDDNCQFVISKISGTLAFG